MCGRYALYGPHSRLRERFDIQDDFPEFPPRFNVAPGSIMPVIRQEPDGRRKVEFAQWGMIPSWATDTANIPHPINAKVETAAIKPMFRHAFRSNRVLVPADCFYEWKAVAGQKLPFLIRMRDREPFGMGGLLECREGQSGVETTFAILTTNANPLVAEIHDRMPVIIRPEDYDRWLDPENRDVGNLLALTGPHPERLMESFRIGRQINRPEAEGHELIAPVTEEF
jgi:putative SOS response-associated peptidase YedK